MLRWFEHRQVFQPFSLMEASGAELNRPHEDVFFQAADGVELNGWFFPAAPDSSRKGLAILVCHGNAGNISHRLVLCDVLLQSGASVFVFDYRGYGRSRGRPGEDGTYQDAEGAVAWLGARGFPPANIIGFGESLGGGVVTELALRGRLGAIILLGSFTSVPDVGAELFPWLPVQWISRIRYDTRAKLPRLDVPVLVMHSRQDTIIPFAHAERNFAAAREPKMLWELRGDHNDVLDADTNLFIEGIGRFLETLEGRSSPAR